MTSDQTFQYATVKIKCNAETGTALLYSPGDSLDYMYVLTAKHCLAGKNFDRVFVNTDISIEKIFNPSSGTWHSYSISNTDKVICTESNELDLALIIIPKANIENLSGVSYPFQIVDEPGIDGKCLIRGFADFNSGDVDRPYELRFSEKTKNKSEILIFNFDGSLDTRYQSAVSNVQGLSGSGLFAAIKGELFLLGSAHTYEEKNKFFATQVTTFNYLLPEGYVGFSPIKPEENDEVIKTFNLISINKDAIKVRTRDKVGNIHIPRFITDASAMLARERMVVFHGKAGVGKSALAKALIEHIEENADNTVVTFTAEQLFFPTLNEALISAGYTADILQIINSSLSRKRIVFWVESFEKLVEAGFGGAFTELLAAIKTNRRLSLVVTIRSFFLQKFKIFFQYELPSLEVFYPVQEFNDDEILLIRQQIPDIQPLLDNPKLNHLLHNPYYLDKAVRIYPQLLKVDNLDEAEFKRLMWEEIVESGNRDRGITFSVIALKRARAMELFTPYEPDSLTDVLVSDNILQVEQGELKNRFSPAHDILEDWALIRYIKQQKQNAATPELFLKNLDNGPAIRRAFRLWLDDYYRQSPNAADDFSSEILSSTKIDQTWKDELTVFILSSENAYPLFASLKERLLENNAALLSKFIHLLRTCCKALKNGTLNFDDLIPVGSGWDAIIDFIAANKSVIDKIADLEYAVISVILEWGKQLPDFNPVMLPPGARSSALLLIDHIVKYQSQFNHYRRSADASDTWVQALKLLFKLTSVAQTEVKRLLDAAATFPSSSDELWTSKNLLLHVRNYIVDGVDADQVCKYFPDVVIDLAKDKWREKPRPQGSLMRSITVQHGPDYWGLDSSLDHYYDAASAYQTFFYWMFLYHPDKAISFLTAFLNDAFNKNQQGRPRGGDQWQEVSLNFNGAGVLKYFGGQDYWNLYRGQSAFHAVIQSLLMALEKGLLDLAEKGDENYPKVREIIKDIILESNNVAVLAVVSSVFQAFPKLLDETSIVLLSNRALFEWDGTRYANDMLPGGYYGTNRFLGNERIHSNALRHRIAYYRGLIGFVNNYMFAYQTLNAKLFEQVDAMWATAKNTYWRKALFDMDARKWVFKPVDVPGYENYVQVVPHYDADVAAVVSSYQTEEMPSIGLVWASNVFEGKPVDDRSYDTWKKGIQQLSKPAGALGFTRAPGIMACLGFRDYFNLLTQQEMEWCRDQIIAQANRLLNADPHDIFSIGDTSHFDKNAVLYALPLLFKLPSDTFSEHDLKSLIIKLLLSRIDKEPRNYLLLSISENLWKLEPAFALKCWLAMFKLIEKKQISDNGYKTLDPEEEDWEDPETRQSQQLTEGDEDQTLIDEVISGNAIQVDTTAPRLGHHTRWQLDDVVKMLPIDTELEIHIGFIETMLNVHFEYLGGLKQYDTDEYKENRDTFKFFYARYLLGRESKVGAVLLRNLLDRTLVNPEGINNFKIIEFIYAIIKQVISAINNWPSITQPVDKFWSLWAVLRDWIMETKRAYLIPLLLLELGWNETCDDWHVLEGKKSFYREFILNYGFNHINVAIDLISGVGLKTFMPEGVTWVASMLTSNLAYKTKTTRLEKLANRAFFQYGKEIKNDKVLTENFLFILDFLIERGSPKAYMLKEEMIQYK